MKVLREGKPKITFNFGMQKLRGEKYNHKGIDMVKSPSSLEYIVAAAKGKVITVINNIEGFKKNSYGNYVVLEHGGGVKTLYAHMKKGSVTVKKGDIIDKGTVIGYMGNSGYAYGAHLHFEVILEGKQVDPMIYLQDKKIIQGYADNIKYTTGNYITKYVMRVRQGPSIKYIQKKVKDLTLDGKNNATNNKPSSLAAYKEETIFTAMQIVYEDTNIVWAKSPSGYICIRDKAKEYCKKI